jgi:pimeloyl-ACP methyl ester carboxylesterase
MRNAKTHAGAIHSAAAAALVLWLCSPIVARESEMTITERPFALIVNGTSAPALVSLPASGDPAWGVVLVPGSFMNDIDGNYLPDQGNPFTARTHVYQDLARQLAEKGCAALRYARGGVAIVDKDAAQAHRHFADRVAVVVEAVRVLRDAVPSIKHIALAGHSEGGPVSLLLITGRPDVPIDAYVSLSAPALRMFDIMRQQTERSVKDGKVAFGPMTYSFADYEAAMALVREDRPVPADLLKRLPPMGVWAMDEASRRYLREYDAVDSSRLIAGVSCPVLIVQGLEDTSVSPDNADGLLEARKGSPAPTDVVQFPGLQHFYKRVPPGLDPMAAFGLETESDPAVAAAICEWLRRLPEGK